MARRTMTLRRIDPWSVLKFGFVLNACLLVVMLLGAIIVWLVIRQLGLINQVCELLLDVGFEQCGVDGANLFRIVLLLGVLGTVILTGLAVFGAFLHNLLADLVGGITFGVREEGPSRREPSPQRPRSASVASGGETQRTESLGTPPPPSDRGEPGRAEAGGQGSEASAQDREERPSWTPSSASDNDRLFGGSGSGGGASGGDRG